MAPRWFRWIRASGFPARRDFFSLEQTVRAETALAALYFGRSGDFAPPAAFAALRE
jgi:hypothetical protein